ncbi:MAG TPA: hypothetical protein VFI95_22890 [Terriglobales bacterium]|nr:hypothetical protein [Terriglobales bacterium]
MTRELKKKIQVVLAIGIAVAAIRTAYILSERYESKGPAVTNRTGAPPLEPDYYVTTKKLHAYDLKSARELTNGPVWIKEGYRYTYYPYDPAHHRADFAHEAGRLLPLEKLQIRDVVLNPSPLSKDQKQVMAVFQVSGKDFAVPVGVERSGDFRIYADEMMFLEDPRQLYKHWPAEIWEAINKHEVRPGMSELQADFAIGMGIPEPANDSDVRTLDYPNGGKPLTVTYQGGKATRIQPGPQH